MNDEEVAKKIVEEGLYMSLATSDFDSKEVWIAPVFYVVDEDFNFYFSSSAESRHGKHLLKNGEVAVAIFDSQQYKDFVGGVQIKGKAEVIDDSEYEKVVKLYDEKKMALGDSEEKDFDKYRKGIKKVFRIKPEKVYISDNEYYEKHKIDKRKEVKL
jgi:uncharacterized protein YhbP (UPF0306 family)